MANLLNLTDADDSGFDPLPAGTYICEVFSWEEAATKGGENAKLPAGTAMLKMQFKVLTTVDGDEVIDDGGTEVKVENRRFFGQWVIPPVEIDGEPYKHYKMMMGNLLRLLKAIGYSEEQLRAKKGFDIESLNDDIGKQVRVNVGRDMEYNSNPVKSVRAVGEEVTAGLL